MNIVLAVIAIIVVWVIYTYNSFVSLRNRGSNAWADIDVELKRRYDLIPNLVEVVKGYASHEKSIFEDVARLRSMAAQSGGVSDRSKNEFDLTASIKTIFAVAENYPLLKADSNFRDLQTQLSVIEDHIQSARKYYNAVVRDFNTKLGQFPSNVIGSIGNFARLEYFQIEDDARNPVQVGFK